MDRFDIALLEALQADSRRSMADLGERIGLSASACHRRIKALEEAGMIAGYAARLNPTALGLGLQQWIAGLVVWAFGHTLAVFAAKRDPDFAPVRARHLRQKGHLAC